MILFLLWQRVGVRVMVRQAHHVEQKRHPELVEGPPHLLSSPTRGEERLRNRVPANGERGGFFYLSMVDSVMSNWAAISICMGEI
jgi:hypothetical protein